jgi:WXG100 family type VII secretion target
MSASGSGSGSSSGSGGSIIIGSSEFQVDLAQFSAAITTVSGCRDAIQEDLTQLESAFSSLASSWQSPAGETYNELQSSLVSAANQMMDVLNEMVTRMQTTQETYENAESSNAANLT